ncbi:MAG: hypothetical protein AMK71_08135 [Nitrospira bacterium SG8_35_4]|nr:MAG: hypothetical protein AMK71_08135 [Nitrospira bacterium SG8_35_4]
MRTLILVIALISGIGGCATNSKQVVEDDGLSTAINISGSIYVNPVEDQTAGQALDPKIKQEVTETLKQKIIDSGKYQLAQLKNGANYVLNIKVIQFTAGNRAARLWVGFGLGSAKLTFVCELYDSQGNIVDRQKFQRFGAASLRSGDSIIEQMKYLLIEYSSKWINV